MNLKQNKCTFLFETPSISRSKARSLSQKDKGNTNVLVDNKNPLELKCEPFVESGEDWIKMMLPIFTASEANGGVKKSYMYQGKKCYKNEHWTEKHKRTKIQKGNVFMMLRPYVKMLKLPCTVTLTRYAPRKLDKNDNLPMSLKYVLDAICAVITGDYRPGRADSSDEINVVYNQVPSKQYGVLLEIKLTN